MSGEPTDRVNEAAVVPELWRSVLDGLAALSGSAGTVLSRPTTTR